MDDAKRKYEMKTIGLKITNWIINSAAVLRRWWAWCELSKCLKLWHFDLVCRRHQCTLDVRHVMRMRVESFLNSKSADELSRECLKLKLIWSHSTTFSSLSFRVRSNTNFGLASSTFYTKIHFWTKVHKYQLLKFWISIFQNLEKFLSNLTLLRESEQQFTSICNSQVW